MLVSHWLEIRHLWMAGRIQNYVSAVRGTLQPFFCAIRTSGARFDIQFKALGDRTVCRINRPEDQLLVDGRLLFLACTALHGRNPDAQKAPSAGENETAPQFQHLQRYK